MAQIRRKKRKFARKAPVDKVVIEKGLEQETNAVQLTHELIEADGLPPLKVQEPVLSSYDLQKALYHCWDAADRGALQMFLRGETAAQALKREQLSSSKLYLGFRKREYVSGQGRIFTAFMEHEGIVLQKEERVDGDYLTYTYQGTPVEIKLYEDNPTIMNLDPIVYAYETFFVPSPYADFVAHYQ